MLEPVLREPGNIVFQWMEIKRQRPSLLQQQLEAQSNEALNITLSEYGNELRIGEPPDCEYKCPELNACIHRDLWCDGEFPHWQWICQVTDAFYWNESWMITGQPNCPSGYDESEEECGTARRLLELPGSMFAALGCVAAAMTACLIFCVFGLVRRKRKSNASKHSINNGLPSGGTMSPSSTFGPASFAATLHHQQQHQYQVGQHHHQHHADQQLAPGVGHGGLGTYHPGNMADAGTMRRTKHARIVGGGSNSKKDKLTLDVDVTSWQHETNSIYIHVDRETTV